MLPGQAVKKRSENIAGSSIPVYDGMMAPRIELK
jgi:hypothetical protein